jgi:4-coumarate--CoA ligase
MIYRSPFPDVEIPDVTISDFVFSQAATRGDAIALRDGLTGATYTFGGLVERVRRLAGGLAARGVGAGTVVALVAPNSPDYAVAFHAVVTAGGTLTTVNPAYTAEEIRYQLVDSRASFVIAAEAVLPVAEEAVRGTDVTHGWSIGVTTSPAGGVVTERLDNVDGEPLEQVAVDVAEHIAVLPYSSGTTGLPKGVMLTHRNLVANLRQVQAALQCQSGEVALAVLPFFHIYGMQVVMNGLLERGVQVVTMPRFDLAGALGLIQEQRVTRFFAVPPIVLALAKHPLVDEYDLSSLRHIMSGAAPLGAELTLVAQERVGCAISQGYGMTELSPVTHCAMPGEECHGTSGRAVPNTATRLVDPETGLDVAAGEPGELWVQGPQVMRGYLNNLDATNAMITSDGWLKTGDIAVIDDEGYMTVVDRVKELIKVKGFQVAPAELEALLLTHPQIADVAVIGVADEESGEVPKAFVVARDPALTADEVMAFVAEHVATYKRVRHVDFLEMIPKSPSGKILRRLLRSG